MLKPIPYLPAFHPFIIASNKQFDSAIKMPPKTRPATTVGSLPAAHFEDVSDHRIATDHNRIPLAYNTFAIFISPRLPPQEAHHRHPPRSNPQKTHRKRTRNARSRVPAKEINVSSVKWEHNTNPRATVNSIDFSSINARIRYQPLEGTVTGAYTLEYGRWFPPATSRHPAMTSIPQNNRAKDPNEQK